jgi:hypothetical protein
MGYLIAPDDQDALNNAIAELSTTDHGYMRKNARDYAEKYLSIDKVMREFERTIVDLLPERKQGHAMKVGELADEVRH